MIDSKFKLLLFIIDFTGQGADYFYWFENSQLQETTASEVVTFPGAVVCHDFWMIRDVLFDKTGDLPATIIDLDEFRITIDGSPDARRARKKMDITAELKNFGATEEICGSSLF
jgi:DNA polymerase I